MSLTLCYAFALTFTPAALNRPHAALAHNSLPRAAVLSRDQFDSMKRADEPLPEEERAVQIVCGGVGAIFGSRLTGSSLFGLGLGVLAGSALANDKGSSGVWARELGCQLSEAARRLADEARRREIPKLVGDGKAAALRLYRGLAAELRALDEALGARAKARSFGSAAWSRTVTWSDKVGLTPRVASLWTASRLELAWERLQTGVSKRRRAGK